MSHKPASCGECDHTFERDPVLEVPCPVCEAGVGVKCASVAPSGHRKSAGFSKLPPWGHDERELLAAAQGCYFHTGCFDSYDELARRRDRAREKLGLCRFVNCSEPRREGSGWCSSGCERLTLGGVEYHRRHPAPGLTQGDLFAEAE